jgi:tRNA pseudouridine32 synthase / 23S rRNA pseudouridine746 synthase
VTRPQAAWTPALRDGVSASRVAVGPVGGVAHWPHLLAFLMARMPAVNDWHDRMLRGDVLDATGQALAADAPALPGAVVWYWRQPPPEPHVPFEVVLLHQDEHLVVVDKPHFLPVTPGGRHLHETVLVRLRQQLGMNTLVPLHRLDLDTAGVLLFSVQPATRNAYHALFRDQQVHKVYEAVAPWRADLVLPRVHSSHLAAPVGRGFMQMQTLAAEPNAHTRIELIQRLRRATDEPQQALYRLTPLTGRKHQLRAHMAELGLPIAGDRIYPTLWPEPPPGAVPDWSEPLQLLARELAFTDPISRQARLFTSLMHLDCTRISDG